MYTYMNTKWRVIAIFASRVTRTSLNGVSTREKCHETLYEGGVTEEPSEKTRVREPLPKIYDET